MNIKCLKMNNTIFIHPLSDVQSKQIGDGTKIWQFSVVLEGAEIGTNCNINANVFIENKVKIGDNCTIKSGVQIWDGITISDSVFIGPNATFTNDIRPRSKVYPEKFSKTYLEFGCSIGANATILPNLTIGKYAMVAAGSVVTRTVPSNALVMGCPARIVGWVSSKGSRMKRINQELFIDSDGLKWRVVNEELVKI